MVSKGSIYVIYNYVYRFKFFQDNLVRTFYTGLKMNEFTI